MNTQLLQQARALDIDEQIELVEAIWDGIVSRGAVPALTEAQTTELDRRRADHLANPDELVPWNEVKAAALDQIRPSACPSLFIARPVRSSSKPVRGMKASGLVWLSSPWPKSTVASAWRPNIHSSLPLCARTFAVSSPGRFPYSVYFRAEDRRIVVLAVFHGSRDPGTWQART